MQEVCKMIFEFPRVLFLILMVRDALLLVLLTPHFLLCRDTHTANWEELPAELEMRFHLKEFIDQKERSV